MKKALALFLLSFLLVSCVAEPTLSPALPSPLPSTATPTPNGATSSLADYFVPPYYQPSYLDVIEASKKEKELVIYSVMSEENWQPILQTFASHYPWIKVRTVLTGTSEVFSRYLAEAQESSPTADLLISSDVGGWYNIVSQGEILTYRSQEALLLPGWSTKYIGLYVVSSDPTVLIYNKKLVGNPPNTLRELGELIGKNPRDYQGQVITYDVATNASGLALNWFWLKQYKEDGWRSLTAIGQSNPILTADRFEMVDAVGSGRVKLGYFVTGITVFSNLKKYPDMGYAYIQDGQPLFLRYMAITQKSQSPNSAKLLVDFILSQEGQMAVSLGGLTPYRADVAPLAAYHLDKIEQIVGSENLVFLEIDPELTDPTLITPFIERWTFSVQQER
jgi:iron(III) transport system substrate-binding protein